MELVLVGWLKNGYMGLEINTLRDGNDWRTKTISEEIMDKFSYQSIRQGLGRKISIIENAHIKCYFSDEECTLEEAEMNFDCYMETGQLFTDGHYVGYSEWTIEGFNIDDLIIGGHDLNAELKDHVGQYIHFILTD